MFKEMKKRIKNEKGLTLIELLAVIVILAIIAAIAIPAIGNIINNSRDKAVLSDVQNAISAAKIARADGSCNGDVCSIDPTVNPVVNEFEFTSDKLTKIDVDFSNANSIEVTTTLKAAFKGDRIKNRITAAAADANNNSTAGTISSANVLKVTESRLNNVLGN